MAKNKEWAARRGKGDLEDGWVAKKRDRWLRREMDMGKLVAPLLDRASALGDISKGVANRLEKLTQPKY